MDASALRETLTLTLAPALTVTLALALALALTLNLTKALREAIAALHDALQAKLSVRWFTSPRARSLAYNGSRLRARARVKGSG